MWWLLACTHPIAPIADSPVVLDEVMADDRSTLRIDGTPSPWIELYNRSEAPIDAERIALDGAIDAWVGDPGDALAPGEHRVVPFGVNADGDRLTLSLDGEPVDRLATGDLPGDVALARIPSGGRWAPTTWATPYNPSRTAPSPSLDPSEALFRADGPLALSLGLSAASWSSLGRAPRTEAPAAFAFEAAFFPEVGARLKGQWGSLRTLDQKCAWKVDFDAYAAHGRLRGVEVLTLNNDVQDLTFVHEVLAYELFRAAGVPAPRVGWAELTVNDQPFGLYTVVETVDHVFLGRWYADPHGPLFEGAYGVDFDPGTEGAFQLDQGAESDRAYLTDVIDALQQPPNDVGVAHLDTVVDLDEFLREAAVEAATADWDGYASKNNYRVYRDPIDGRFDLIPWGKDQAWITRYDAWDAAGSVVRYCFANARCRDHYRAILREVAELVDALPLTTELEALDAWIAPLAAEDPRREFDDATRESQLETTRTTIAEAAAWLRDQADR